MSQRIPLRAGDRCRRLRTFRAAPKVSYGANGTNAQTATDIQAGIGAGNLSTILPGETQTVKLGYGIPAAEFGNVRMEVNGPTFNDKPAIFKGAVQ